jgi:hypothetical protein
MSKFNVEDSCDMMMEIFPSGSQEVVGDLEALIDDNHLEDLPRAEPHPGEPPPQDNRRNIDNLIQQLQREQDQRIAREGLHPLGSPPPPGGSPRINRSNSGKSALFH